MFLFAQTITKDEDTKRYMDENHVSIVNLLTRKFLDIHLDLYEDGRFILDNKYDEETISMDNLYPGYTILSYIRHYQIIEISHDIEKFLPKKQIDIKIINRLLDIK